MNHRIPGPSREDLIKQLHYFDEFADELDRLVDPPERERIFSLIQSYRKRVEYYMASRTEPPASEVLIGRSVTIRYEDGDVETYKVVLPNASNVDEGCLSFISPLGSRLVLSTVGDSLEVESPSGRYRVQVMGIAHDE